MSPVGFEPTISAGERPQTYALDRAATGTGINTKIILFTKKVMGYWRTRMRLHAENKLTETEDIKIQRGIFQGDPLSPLLFCICLLPLTEQLNKLDTGYEDYTTKTKISHILYLDDLKLIAKSDEKI